MYGLDIDDVFAVFYSAGMVERVPTGFRLSPAAMNLLDILKRRMGISKTAVIETAVRELAQIKGVKQ